MLGDEFRDYTRIPKSDRCIGLLVDFLPLCWRFEADKDELCPDDDAYEKAITLAYKAQQLYTGKFV